MNRPKPSANKDNSVIWPELWSAFESHRHKICQLLTNLSKGPDSRLCVLGSGRTTDLDLIELLKYFSTIDLVDLDPNLTTEALVQRGFDQHPAVKAHGGKDVTGLGKHWQAFRDSPNENGLIEIIESCTHIDIGMGEYDVVASTCLLSQLMKNAAEYIESSGMSASISQTYFSEVIKAIREQHLRLMLEHTVSGGSAVLITDLTSAEALPEILNSQIDLLDLISSSVIEGNHFPGLNPMLIAESLQSPAIAVKIAQVQLTSPWIWNSIESKYLCIGYRIQRK